MCAIDHDKLRIKKNLRKQVWLKIGCWKNWFELTRIDWIRFKLLSIAQSRFTKRNIK